MSIDMAIKSAVAQHTKVLEETFREIEAVSKQVVILKDNLEIKQIKIMDLEDEVKALKLKLSEHPSRLWSEVAANRTRKSVTAPPQIKPYNPWETLLKDVVANSEDEMAAEKALQEENKLRMRLRNVPMESKNVNEASMKSYMNETMTNIEFESISFVIKKKIKTGMKKCTVVLEFDDEETRESILEQIRSKLREKTPNVETSNGVEAAREMTPRQVTRRVVLNRIRRRAMDDGIPTEKRNGRLFVNSQVVTVSQIAKTLFETRKAETGDIGPGESLSDPRPSPVRRYSEAPQEQH
jgi:hypothetical protein